MVLVATVAAMAQTTPVGPYGGTGYTSTNTYTNATATASDVLGAHNGYGRGCVMCHAPHSGSWGNGLALSGDPNNGEVALWGQDLTPLFGYAISFSGDGNTSKYPVTLPTTVMAGIGDANTIILLCLSCHDGVLTKVGMMEGQTVEVLPIVGGHAPTLLGLAKPTAGTSYSNDHPVGGSAVVTCNGGSATAGATKSLGSGHQWDCIGGGPVAINMTGPASSVFITNYKGSFWNTGATNGISQKLASFNSGSVVTAVTCTSCHNQHSMTVYNNNYGNFGTMFFIKGQYTPLSNGNSVAQFCRNCHGGESNEMHGLTNVPTI